MSDDYFKLYMQYTEITEVPKTFHRWCAISSLATILNRQLNFQLGHFNLFPNAYVMLIGSPGTRKSTAIKISKALVAASGFDKFAAERSTKEKFLIDLLNGCEDDEPPPEADLLTQNLFGDLDETSGFREMYIAADEFNDFIGNGNMEFISMLGSLWDFNGVYSNRIKNGKSVKIPNPTINILSGNTPTGFALAFPPDVLGQGFFSRLLLIYGESTGKKIAFPPPPDTALQATLIDYLVAIKTQLSGYCAVTDDAQELLSYIYSNWNPVDDIRFESYSNRRFTHLLKLTMIMAAARLSTTIGIEDVIHANTVLTHAEHLMPKALGEFGRSKNSALTHRILEVLGHSPKPLNLNELYSAVHSDADSQHTVQEIVGNMLIAGKLQTVRGGFLPIKKVLKEVDSNTVDFSLLTDEERSYTL